MIVLNEKNEFLNTSFVRDSFYYSVLSFDDYQNPDFMFRETNHLVHFTIAGIALELFARKHYYKIVVPMHWWILLGEMDEVQTIPLYELCRNDYLAFCFNPIDGRRPELLNMRVASSPSIYPNAGWTSPPVAEKDLILIPLGPNPDTNNGGPLCAMFSTNKFEVSRTAGDIWG